MKEVENEDDLVGIIRKNERLFTLFYASWCPFCSNFLPIFEKYAQKFSNEKFLRVKIDDEMNPLWEKYAIEVVPTVLLFEGERVARRVNGVLGVGLNEKKLEDLR